MAILRREPPNEGVECRLDRQKSRFCTNTWLHRLLSTLRLPSVIYTAAPYRVKWVTLIAGKRRHLLFAGRRTTKCLWQKAVDRRQQNII